MDKGHDVSCEASGLMRPPTDSSSRVSTGDTRRIRINSAWMVAEQVARQTISLLLTIWIARALGPVDMGGLSFALSLHALFGIVTTLGLNRILVREFAVVTDPADEHRLIATALAMRILCGVVMAVAALASCALLSAQHLALVTILVFGYFFSAFDFVDLLFQSKLRSRDVARVRFPAFAASAAVKATLLLGGAGPDLIAFACLLDWVFIGLALAWLYARTSHRPLLRGANIALARRLFAESRIEIAAGFSGMAFMKFDQIMLQVLRDPAEVAIMAVSSRLTEAWYFIPTAIVASTFPVIVRLGSSSPESALIRLRRLYREVIVLAVGAALAVSFTASWIIHLLYGSAYSAAAPVLEVQIWCGVFMALGITSGSWLMANRQGVLNLRRNLLGAAMNIGLNFLLIPAHGALGAAWATLAAFATAYLFYDFLDPSMRDVGVNKLRAVMWR